MSEFKKIILVDFDGVIHSYISGWKGIDVIADPPVDGAIDWLARMSKTGRFEICIYSSRSKEISGVNAMRQWLMDNGMASSEVACIGFPTEKPPAWLTIDDRAMQFNGVFPSADEMNDFKPWYKRQPCVLCNGCLPPGETCRCCGRVNTEMYEC